MCSGPSPSSWPSHACSARRGTSARRTGSCGDPGRGGIAAALDAAEAAAAAAAATASSVLLPALPPPPPLPPPLVLGALPVLAAGAGRAIESRDGGGRAGPSAAGLLRRRRSNSGADDAGGAQNDPLPLAADAAIHALAVSNGLCAWMIPPPTALDGAADALSPSDAEGRISARCLERLLLLLCDQVVITVIVTALLHRPNEQDDVCKGRIFN